MRQERAIDRELVKSTLQMLEDKTTTLAEDIYREPTDYYVSPDRFELEYKAFFQSRAQMVGLSGDLPRIGSYFTLTLADTPVLVVRVEDGLIKAFLNVCRHRAGSVAKGRSEVGRVFTCPYHAWSYDINGKLLGQPAASVDGFKGVDRDCTGLIELPAVEKFGLLYVRPDPDGGPIDVEKELAGLAPDLAEVGFAGFEMFEERHSTWSMNWKQPQDSFLEAYHIFALHRDSLSKETLSTPMKFDAFGPHGRGVILQRTATGYLEKPEQELTARNVANIVYWIFPNTVLNLPAPGHAEVWQFYPDQKQPNRTRTHTRFYRPAEGLSEKALNFTNDMVDFTMGFVAEDFDQQEAILRNVSAGRMGEMIFGRNEPALIHYHRSIDKALREAEPAE